MAKQPWPLWERAQADMASALGREKLDHLVGELQEFAVALSSA